MRKILLALAALLLFHAPASATWSVIAIDTVTGQVVIASATCVPQGRFAGFPAKGLMDIQAIVVPGIGVAAAQAGVDNTRANQQLIYRELRRGTPPEEIIGMLSADPNYQRRQFGIVDKQGRTAGFSGQGNGYVSEHMAGPVPGTNIIFSVQGNILASHQVVQQAARAFREGDGTMVERVMRAMEKADAAGRRPPLHLRQRAAHRRDPPVHDQDGERGLPPRGRRLGPERDVLQRRRVLALPRRDRREHPAGGGRQPGEDPPDAIRGVEAAAVGAVGLPSTPPSPGPSPARGGGASRVPGAPPLPGAEEARQLVRLRTSRGGELYGTMGRWARAALLAGALVAGASAPAGAQAHEHGGGSGWSLGAGAIPLATRAAPAMGGEVLTEAYLSQPVVAGHARLPGGWLALQGMLNLEGLTLRRGELNAGIWGEGYVDRRHPHTYLHEAVATATIVDRASVAASVSVGKGFAPFGTDDPMSRPFVKYPANHHLAQILERLVAIGALRAGPLLVEGGIFNGDEPRGPGDLASPERFGDSWSARASLLPLAGLEAQASYASVASPEFPAGSGLDHRKWSASARYEAAGQREGASYVLVEWARTDEYAGEERSFTFESWLAEAALRRGGAELAVRLESTLRPEEERLEDPFRTPVPHPDVHLLGVTRWRIATASLAAPALEGSGLRARPFVEVARARVEETLGSPVFDPAELYGSDRLWSLSLGARVQVGSPHGRMGRYGVAAVPPAQSP